MTTFISSERKAALEKDAQAIADLKQALQVNETAEIQQAIDTLVQNENDSRASISELEAKVEALKAENENLKAAVETANARIAELEAEPAEQTAQVQAEAEPEAQPLSLPEKIANCKTIQEKIAVLKEEKII